MWYVKAIRDERESNKSDGFLRKVILGPITYPSPLKILFRDTMTAFEYEFDGADGEGLVKFLQAENPMGAGYLLDDMSGLRLRTFVTVTPDALRFLDYVQGIESLESWEYQDARSHLIGVEGGKWFDDIFTPIDAPACRTFSACLKSGVESPGTLFDVLCYSPIGWYKDAYYIHGGFQAWRRCETATCFRVTFKDVAKARTMIAKTVALGKKCILLED